MASTVYRRPVTWVAASAVLIAMLGLGTGRAAAAADSGCPGVSQPTVTSGTTPILFVHGINSGPWVWTPGPGGPTGNVEGTGDTPLRYIQSSLGNGKVTGYTFDWSSASGAADSKVMWVTPTLGKSLSLAIGCVARHAGHRVIIIAWSMGGLLALDAGSIDPADVAAVFTLGTPYQGSWLASAFAGQAPDDLGPLASAIIAVCSFTNLPVVCPLVNERNDAGVEAMRLNGGPAGGWTKLPAWPTTTTITPSISSSTNTASTTAAAFPVYSLAGSITGTWQPLWPLTIGEVPLTGSGDWVVSTGSQRGTLPGTTLSCPVTLSGDSLTPSASIADLLETGPCIHTSEPDSKSLLDYIITTVRPMLPTATTATIQPESCGPVITGVDGSGGPITCHDAHPSLAADRYFRHWPFTVLSLGPHATLKEVEAAICYDVHHVAPDIPMAADAALLAGSEQAWPYAPSLLGNPWKICGLAGG